MAGTIVVPGTNTGFNLNSYKRGAEDATYQKMKLIPRIEDYGMRLYGTGNVRKWARLPGNTLSQTADGSGLTYSNFIATAVTVTAGGNYSAISWSRNESAQVDIDLQSGGTSALESALAEASDATVFLNVASNTQVLSQTGADAPGWRIVVGRLMTNTNGVVVPGEDRKIYAVFTTTQYPNVVAIPEFNNAQMRGDSENPYVKGIVSTAGGINVDFSTVVYSDANGWHCPVFIQEAYVVGWNVRTEVDFLQDELQFRLIAYNNLGSNVQHDLRAVDWRLTASAI